MKMNLNGTGISRVIFLLLVFVFLSCARPFETPSGPAENAKVELNSEVDNNQEAEKDPGNIMLPNEPSETQSPEMSEMNPKMPNEMPTEAPTEMSEMPAQMPMPTPPEMPTPSTMPHPAGSCLATFKGPLIRPNRNFEYTTFKIASWAAQARFDMTGSKFFSHMNGYNDFRGPVPIQFNVDWGTNKINPDGTPDGRRDMWSSMFNTPPRQEAACIYGGVIVGTQPLNATWGETKRPGGGYAITINGGRGTTVEGVRIHNHHDAFVPYRNDGFMFRDNWVSYTRDDCIENDGNAEGSIENNLFDGCYVFISASRSWSAKSSLPNGAGPKGRLRIVGNLIKFQNMPGPYNRDVPLGIRTQSGYGQFWKTQREDSGIPTVVFRNNVIAFEDPITKGGTNMTGPGVDIVECANNTILWLGSGPYPGQLPAGHENCFTILTGSAARQRWIQERQKWIDAHPNIPRI